MILIQSDDEGGLELINLWPSPKPRWDYCEITKDMGFKLSAFGVKQEGCDRQVVTYNTTGASPYLAYSLFKLQ